MEKLTKEQVKKEIRVTSSPLKRLLAELEVGEGVKYTKQEWRETGLKSVFNVYIHTTYRKSRADLKFSIKDKGEYWIIYRIK